MKEAIIDIGSNSMRLTAYETDAAAFKVLFREKFMAGLAGYVENGCLSEAGIQCACGGLLDFRETLTSLNITEASVFATASLRNIKNTEQAVSAITEATGYHVEVIGGEEEAMYGYLGAIRDVDIARGAVVDVGGASTEIVIFGEEGLESSFSFPIGSLNLYRSCVKKIMPGETARKEIRKVIRGEISKARIPRTKQRLPLICVGGTARAVLKLAVAVYALPKDCGAITAEQLEGLCTILYRGDRRAVDLILKIAPDRVHTIIPGIMVLRHIVKSLGAETLTVSKYGVREGYLCRKSL